MDGVGTARFASRSPARKFLLNSRLPAGPSEPICAFYYLSVYVNKMGLQVRAEFSEGAGICVLPSYSLLR